MDTQNYDKQEQNHHYSIDLLRFNKLVSLALIAIVAGLIPWTVFLAIKLPIRYTARHWTLLWVGFDLVLMIVLAYTAWAAWFRKQIMVVMSIVAGTMLAADAWFDVITSLGKRGEWITLLTAFLAEIPGSIFFFWLARAVILRSIDNVYKMAGIASSPPRLRDTSVLYTLSSLSTEHKNLPLPTGSKKANSPLDGELSGQSTEQKQVSPGLGVTSAPGKKE